MNVPFVTSKGSNRLTSAAYYIGRTPRAVRQPLQDVVRHLVTALLQNVRDSLGHVLLEAGGIPPSCLLLLLIIHRETLQEERAVAMRLIRWQHWLVLKLRNGLIACIIP